MMLYLATLTVNLAWQGWLCIRNRRDHRGQPRLAQPAAAGAADRLPR
jgi:hypothetical protein